LPFSAATVESLATLQRYLQICFCVTQVNDLTRTLERKLGTINHPASQIHSFIIIVIVLMFRISSPPPSSRARFVSGDVDAKSAQRAHVGRQLAAVRPTDALSSSSSLLLLRHLFFNECVVDRTERRLKRSDSYSVSEVTNTRFLAFARQLSFSHIAFYFRSLRSIDVD
jgi:hypothetical protein